MSDQSPRVAVRVDASAEIGTGHFMRCLTLADALRLRQRETQFVSRHMPAHLRELATARGHRFVALPVADRRDSDRRFFHSGWLETTESEDSDATRMVLADSNFEIVVVDHYSLGAAWETALRGATKRIVVIDDLADRPHDCDVLIDQNVCESGSEDYRELVPDDCTRLLGPRFALIRPEFQALHAKARVRGAIGRILVFMGGYDAGNRTGAALEAIHRLGRRDIAVDVVLGAHHPERDALVALCQRRGFACHVQTSSMAELVAAADLAIGAGGTATWERCCLGLPALTICVAENQRRLVKSAAARGLIREVAAGSGVAEAIERELQVLLREPERLRAMSESCLGTVDGRGVTRVLRALEAAQLTIREATAADAPAMWNWRNHPAVRSVSRNPEPIEWPAHEVWLRTVLADPGRSLLIGEHEGRPVGVLRFDIIGEVAHVSLYAVPGLEGRGFGSGLLAAAERWLAAHRRDVATIVADVMEGNDASHALFRAAGYDWKSSAYVKRLRKL